MNDGTFGDFGGQYITEALMGAKVHPVTSGTVTLKDAVDEAMQAWVAATNDAYYLLGSAVGPHPFPTVVRDFQKIIGEEIKAQLQQAEEKSPDAVIACVGGGSNVIGAFYDFIEDTTVKLIGCEAAGDSVDSPTSGGAISSGTVGTFHGMKTFFAKTKTAKSRRCTPFLRDWTTQALGQNIVSTMRKDQIIVVNLSGRGDKDIASAAKFKGTVLS